MIWVNLDPEISAVVEHNWLMVDPANFSWRVTIDASSAQLRDHRRVRCRQPPTYSEEPLSTRTIDPVVCVRWVTQAITAFATSSASIARFKGVAAAAPSRRRK